jgi:glycosyltransferase involved in cell wall biosynthesis
LREFQRRDRRVVLQTNRGRGLAAALNCGASFARGFWLARMDADDVSHPERLTRQLQFATTHELDVCGCDARTFGATIPRVLRHCRGHGAIRLELMFGAPFAHPTVFGRRELFVGAYDETADGAEDFVLWAKLAGQGVRMGNLDARLLRYRVHHQQVTSREPSRRVGVAMTVAREYWPRLVPELRMNGESRMTDRVLWSVFDKSISVDDDVALTLLGILQSLHASYGNPEGILSRNAFNILIRSSPGMQHEPTASALIPALGVKRRSMLFARRVAPIGWESGGIRLIRKYFR